MSHYRAFLSYSHKDRVWGEWLHRALERYRIDPDLVGRETPVGKIPKNLRPIFLDREDFAGGPSLRDATRRALESSDFLIVICSPAARASHYVNEEIRLFKAMGRSERVIPVIVAGEPGDPARECFPPALKFAVTPDGNVTAIEAEPLAADARGHGDGREIAIQKVIAGLLGISLDEIRNRTLRAARRRVALFASMAAVMAGLAVVAGIAAWIAWKRTIEAEQRLDWALETAGAITTKASTFKNKFGVPTPVLTDLLGQVDYLLVRLSEQGVRSSKISLSEARLLGALSDNNKDLGDVAKALEQANAATSRLESVAAQWKSRVVENDLGWSYMKSGDLLLKMNMMDMANRRYSAARQIFESLVTSEPANMSWQTSLAASLARLSDVLSAEGDLDGAIRMVDEDISIKRRLHLANPFDTYQSSTLAISLKKRAGLGTQANDNETAMKFLREALEMNEQLVKNDPTNADWATNLALCQQDVGYAIERQGNLREAIKYYDLARQTLEKLSVQDPLNVSKLALLATSLDTLGYNYQRTGSQSDAAFTFNKMVEVRRRMVKQDPANAAERATLTISLNRLATAQYYVGEIDTALVNAEEAVRLGTELMRSEPRNTNLKLNQVVSLGVSALIKHTKGDELGATEAYQEMARLSDEMAASDPGNANKAFAAIASHIFLSNWFRQMGRANDALETLQPARLKAESLHERSPTDSTWLMALSHVYEQIYMANWDIGDIDAMVDAAERCLNVVREWTDRDKGNNDAFQRLGLAFAIVGNASRRMGRLAEAREAHFSALEIRKKLVAADAANTSFQYGLSVSWSRLADVYWDQQEYARALDAWEHGFAIVRKLVELDRTNVEWQKSLAEVHCDIGNALERLGRGAEAREAYRSALTVRQALAKALPNNDLLARDVVWTKQRLSELGEMDVPSDGRGSASEATGQ